MIDKIDRALTFAIEVEHGLLRSDVVNYDDVRGEIVEKLEKLRDAPIRTEEPRVYHLDVAAMYPNIILTNRLQPCAMVSEAVCASCDFNAPKNNCKRKLKWMWRFVRVCLRSCAQTELPFVVGCWCCTALFCIVLALILLEVRQR